MGVIRGGGQRFLYDRIKTLEIQSIMMGGSKIVQNCVTSFLDDLLPTMTGISLTGISNILCDTLHSQDNNNKRKCNLFDEVEKSGKTSQDLVKNSSRQFPDDESLS